MFCLGYLIKNYSNLIMGTINYTRPKKGMSSILILLPTNIFQFIDSVKVNSYSFKNIRNNYCALQFNCVFLSYKLVPYFSLMQFTEHAALTYQQFVFLCSELPDSQFSKTVQQNKLFLFSQYNHQGNLPSTAATECSALCILSNTSPVSEQGRKQRELHLS